MSVPLSILFDMQGAYNPRHPSSAKQVCYSQSRDREICPNNRHIQKSSVQFHRSLQESLFWSHRNYIAQKESSSLCPPDSRFNAIAFHQFKALAHTIRHDRKNVSETLKRDHKTSSRSSWKR